MTQIGYGDVSHSAVAVATTSTEVLEDDPKRQFLQLVNDSDTDIYIAFGQAAAVNTGVRLNANGGSVTYDSFVPSEAIQAINLGVGTKNLLVTEA